MPLTYQPELQVQPLFPTPVAISPLPDAVRLNAELKAAIERLLDGVADLDRVPKYDRDPTFAPLLSLLAER